MKKILLILLSCALGFYLSAETETIDGIEWTYQVVNGEAQIYSGEWSPAISSSTRGVITIPSSLDGYPVTSIGDYAFYCCYGLTSVTIPNSVTSIGDFAFFCCTGLTSVTILNSVTSIGDRAFEGCYNLWKDENGVKYESANKVVLIDVPESLIGNFVIPTSVRFIHSEAFFECSSLTSVTIPSSVTSIGNSAFYACKGLTSVTIPNGVTTIGLNAFNACKGLTSVTIPSSVTSIGGAAFSGCERLTSVTIPSGVTSIGDFAFSGCTGLTSVTIPSSVTSIGEGAFRGCSGLTSVTIPEGVTSIGDSAFEGVAPEILTVIKIPSGSMSFDKLKTIIIPEGTTIIPNSAFSGYSGLTSVTIPSSVTTIGASAFSGCSGLTSVTIPSSVTTIGDSAFEGCAGLSSVTIPSSVTSIGGAAFSGCERLTSVTIPSGVTSIGDFAFDACSNLASFDFKGEPPNVGYGAFYDIPSSAMGSYLPQYASEWEAVIDANGKWNGLTMMPIEDAPDVINDVKLTFDANGGEGSQTLTQAYGTELIAPTVTREGYTFVGWSPSAPATAPVADKIYVAQWQANQYTIAYSANGGSGTMQQTSATYGESITLPNATFVKEGFYFRGWATEVEGRIIYPDGATVSNLTTEQNGVVNLFAVWGNSNATPEEFFVYSHWHDTNTGRDVVNITGLQGMYPEDIIVPTTIEGVPVSLIGFDQVTVYELLKSITFPDADIQILHFFEECLPNLESVFFKGCHYSIGVSWFPETAIGYYPARYAEEWLSDIESFGEGNGRLFNLKMQLWEDEVVTPEDIALSLLDFSVINDEVVITGLKKANYSGALIIPEKLKGYPVTSIGSNAFYNCSGLTSVTIPFGVNSIGDGAFSGVAPETLTTSLLWLPSGMLKDNLKTLIILEGVTSIGGRAFYGCSSLTSVTIPSSVTSIGEWAFASCTSLTTVTIPEGVTSIEYAVFNGCTSLASVTIPSSVTLLNDPFGYCANLPVDENGVQYESEEKKVLIKAPSAFSGTFVTPESVRFIHGDAFRGCKDLTSILIPEGVISIGGYAFEGCNLTSVTIPSTINRIDYQAFSCTDLTSVTFEGAPPQDCSGFNVGPTGYYFAQYASEWEEVIAADGTWNGLTMRCMEAGKLFTLTFDANGGEGSQTLTQSYGTTFTAPTVTREGYAFAGWYPTVPSKIPAQDVIYTAQWKINQYSITFDAVGGEGGTSVTQDYGSSLTAPTVTREGYTFIGWSPTVPVTVPATNATYTAQWRANQYTQTFDANGGEGGASVTQDYGSSLAAPPVTREGYTFVGWSPNVPATIPSTDATYVAQWRINQYTITFDAAGGEGGTSVTQGYGSSLTAPTVTREGYTFIGWSPSVPVTVLATNATYTAQWRANQYTQTFDANGGEGGASLTQDYASSLIAPTVTREGYTFVGWSPNVPATIPSTDATYVAQWRINQYTITFDAAGGDGGTSVTQDYGTILTAPIVTREGYWFAGWLPDVPTTTPAADMTYTAQWEVPQYTMTFDANGGEGGCEVKQEVGTPLQSPIVRREGYVFIGWLPVVPDVLPTGDVTFVAQWIEKESEDGPSFDDEIPVVANLYVSQFNGSDLNDGLTIQSAFKTIQKAIDVASFGAVIAVDTGIYAPITTGGKRMVIRSINGAKRTIIDGDNDERCATLGTSITENETTLEGFTLQNGSAENGGGAYWGTLKDCILKNNSTTSTTLTNGACSGGAAYQSALINCEINSNRACNGGGIAYGTAVNCMFSNNYAGDDGGAVWHATLYNCLVIKNYSENLGGWQGGGGCYSSTLYNCTVTENKAVLDYSYLDAGLSSCEAYNTIVYNNRSNDGALAEVSAGHEFNCLTSNPNFVDATNGNYHLSASSSGIDRGNNEYVTQDCDLDGARRILNNLVDVGCYEYTQMTVTFDANGGEGGTNLTLEFDAPLVAPNVTRENYTFLGWAPEVPSAVPAANTTYTAQWKAYPIVGVKIVGAGLISGANQYQPGASVVLTATPDEGATFCGWNGFKKTAEATISFVMPEEDVVLTAYFANASALDAYLLTHGKVGGDDLDSLVEAEIAKRDLHTVDEMKEMVVDTPVIEAKNGIVTIRLQVKDGAANEVMDGGELSVEITPKAGEKAGFYKFVVPNQQ